MRVFGGLLRNNLALMKKCPGVGEGPARFAKVSISSGYDYFYHTHSL